MRGRIEEDDATVPVAIGGWLYYQREERASSTGCSVAAPPAGDPNAAEQVLLDENALAEGRAYCHVQLCLPSPDQRKLAYTVDTRGSWEFTLYVLDMESGEIVSGPIEDVAWSVAWADDSRTLFYTHFDGAHRPYQAQTPHVGSDPARRCGSLPRGGRGISTSTWTARAAASTCC